MIDQRPPMPPDRQDLPAGHQAARRVHLMSELAATRRHRPVLRWAVGGLVTAGLSGGLAAALILTPTAEIGGNPPVAPASAAEILDRAAGAAAKPGAGPRPDQYVYTDATQRRHRLPANGSGPVRVEFTFHTRSWQSVSGKRPGLFIASGDDKVTRWICEAAMPKVTKEPKKLFEVDPDKVPGDCRNDPAFRKDLPTDAKAMRAWLYQHSQGGNPPDVQVFHTVGETLGHHRASPAAMAAIFQATKTLPGVTLTRGQVTLGARKGIAIGQSWRGIRYELVFEPTTYQLIGERWSVDHDQSFDPPGGKPRGPASAEPHLKAKQGTVMEYTVINKSAFTDSVPRP
ncbi:CU044_5270 family protein [Spirillospora sp. NPDC048911]|uniref:CU044_5270 family protein n=1 Tax=Spirillospora sp. NPDC048911 TaxID=3364527 RepID=UPI003716A965